MSAANAENTRAPTQASAVTINSPERRPRPDLAPKVTTQAHVRTEHPTRLVDKLGAHKPLADDDIAGNPNMLLSMRNEGQVGVFQPRDVTLRRPTHVTVNWENIQRAVRRVLTYVFTEELRKPHTQDNVTIAEDVNDLALHLTNGICINFYLKMFNLNFFDTRVRQQYRFKPELPAHFEVPAPYALAITQFGQIKLSGMEEEVYLCPTAPAGSEMTFGMIPGSAWSPVNYARCVAAAKRLGIPFAKVDLEVKLGSSWWLYRPVNEGPLFRLECPYPEENFTNNTAALATLFCNNGANGFNNPIINTATLGNNVYCSMLRNPPINVSFNCFYAVTEEKEVVYLFDA